jgi:hypothetical protein
MGLYLSWLHDWLDAVLRRLTERIAFGLLDRFGDGTGLDEAQRAWLLEDLKEDLAAMVDDAENRGVTERAAREMLVIRALTGWLEGGEPPGSDAIRYLESAVRAIRRNPREDELAQRNSYLAAIGDLGGDEEAASRLWREPSGGPEEVRRLLDFQGRKIRELMEERGLSVGELAGRTGIDTVSLVSILFGLEEMRAVEWTRLSEALDVPLDDLVDGHRLVSAGDGVCRLPDDVGACEGRSRKGAER